MLEPEMQAQPQTTAIAVFETAIGHCGIAWGERGVTGVALPSAAPERTRARLLRHHPAARALQPTTTVQEAIDGISALLAGRPRKLTGVVLDTRGVTPFDLRVLIAARTIPPGETITYGGLAARIDAPGEAREVGAALGRNRFPIVVPCHRVVAAGGRLGGFSAPGGSATKRRLLALEQPHARGELTLFAASGGGAEDVWTGES